MRVQQWLKVLGISLLLVGCGSDDVKSSESSTQNSATKSPSGYSYKVINNQGKAVESQLGEYTIRITSNSKEKPNPQARHKGVVVKINGENSQTMPIQISYLDKGIVVSVYDKDNVLLSATDEIKVTDVPVVVVEMTI